MTSPVVVVSLVELERMIESAITKALRSQAREIATDDEYLDRAGAAKLLDIHSRTLGRLAMTAGFPAKRIGRLLRVRRSELLAWVESSGWTSKRGRR